MYRKITGKTGVKYWKDGKFIKKADIPASIFQSLELNPEYDESKECIFCGKPGTKIRQFNLMIVNLCDEDYFSKSLGKIAQQLRERTENGSNTKEQTGLKPESLQPQNIG